jgi:hypothetical protein
MANADPNASLVPTVEPYLNQTCPLTCDANDLNSAFSDAGKVCGTSQSFSPQLGSQAYSVIKAGICVKNRFVARVGGSQVACERELANDECISQHAEHDVQRRVTGDRL